MRAGTLRHRLTIERPEPSRDTTGDEIVTWVRVAEVWASIEPLGGREAQTSDQIMAGLDTRITVRWAPRLDAVAAKWRLRHASLSAPVVYDVVSIEHLWLRQRELRIAARSGRTQG